MLEMHTIVTQYITYTTPLNLYLTPLKKLTIILLIDCHSPKVNVKHCGMIKTTKIVNYQNCICFRQLIAQGLMILSL